MAYQSLKHGGLRVMVCGGEVDQPETVFRALDRIANKHGVVCLVTGHRPGVETAALHWATRRRVPVAGYPITPGEHRTLGVVAEALRNARMFSEGLPDLLVSYPGDEESADRIERARERGILIYDPFTNTVT